MKILSQTEAESFLLMSIPTGITTIKNALKDFDLYLVGGSVRDSFFNKTPKDFDLTTNAMPDEVLLLLSQHNIKCEPRGVEFGVVVATVDNIEYEIATFRTDLSGHTGNLMDQKVKLGVSIEDDVKRRDLTINALFFDLNTNKIIDLVNGIDNLNNNIIKTVGNPDDRFAEDSTRKLRVITRALKTNFDIDVETYNAIKNNPELKCNKERIFTELEKMTINFERMYNLLLDTNLVYEIFPNLNINTIKKTKNNNIFSVFANFLYNNEINDIIDNLNDLKFSNIYINNITFLIKYLKINLNQVNPFVFFQENKKNTINNDSLLETFNNDKNIIALLNFIPNKELSQNLLKDGFTGIELGIKIKEFYFENRTNVF